MATTASITRTELGLSTLALEDSTYGIRAGSFDPGQVRYRRELATSPYVAGALEIGAVADQAIASLVLRVRGTSAADLQTNIATAASAFRQTAYTLTVSLDGTTYSWACQRADIGLPFPDHMRRSYVALIPLSFPRSPIATSGPI